MTLSANHDALINRWICAAAALAAVDELLRALGPRPGDDQPSEAEVAWLEARGAIESRYWTGVLWAEYREIETALRGDARHVGDVLPEHLRPLLDRVDAAAL